MFEKDFETGETIPMQLGRLRIGDGMARLYLTPDGMVHIIVPEKQRAYVQFLNHYWASYPSDNAEKTAPSDGGEDA